MGLKALNKENIINEIRQLSRLSLNIYIHSRSYPGSIMLQGNSPSVFTHVCVNKGKRSFIHFCSKVQRLCLKVVKS